METVPSCDTFQGTSLIFSKSEHIVTIQMKEFIEKQGMAI